MHQETTTKAPGSLTVLGRGLRLRCPWCGRGRLFERWLRLRRYCTECGFRPDRGETDAFIGPYTVNLVVSELIPVTIAVAIGFATWPDVPWRALTWGLVALMLVAPIVTYPFARGFWLALDVIFRPPVRGDFEEGRPANSAG